MLILATAQSAVGETNLRHLFMAADQGRRGYTYQTHRIGGSSVLFDAGAGGDSEVGIGDEEKTHLTGCGSTRRISLEDPTSLMPRADVTSAN